MRLLSVETSSPRGSLCLCEVHSGKLLGVVEESWEKQSSHSEVISEVLLRLLDQKSWPAKSLTHIAVGTGPGSFTGIRVGLNFAKSLSYGLQIPIAAINSLEILAAQAVDEELPIICMVNAYRNQLFAASFENENSKPPQLIDSKDLESWVKKPYLCLGDGFEIFKNAFSPTLLSHSIRKTEVYTDFPRAKDLATIVSHDQGLHKFAEWKNANPLYIRVSSAEEKLKGGALKTLPKF